MQQVDTSYAMPLLVGRTVPSGLLGLVCAGMLAASMSTYSSYLLCWSSVITQDVVAPLCPRGLSSQARIWLTRLWVVLIGIYLIVFGLLFYTPDIWKFLASTGTVYLAGASAAVTLGLYWRRASSAGALAALVLGSLGIAAAFRETLIRHGWLHKSVTAEAIALAAFAASWLAMIALSLAMPDRRARPAVANPREPAS